MEMLERYTGALLGLAAGDAVGTTLEFKAPGSFAPIQDMVGGGPFDLVAGQWTDDTSMALCLAESLIECQGYDPRDQMERYVRWYRQGHLSSTGSCFDIGNTTHSALSAFERTQDPYSGSTDSWAAGNGSIMRLAPVPLVYAHHATLAIEKSGDSSRTTHGSRVAIDACRYLGGLLVGALQGASKEQLLASAYHPAGAVWQATDLAPEIYEIACGSFTDREPPTIEGSGYVVKSLEAALWAFYKSHTFEAGCLLAVNLGDDADTTGAVYGQLAGAYYGIDGIPAHWRAKLTYRPLLEQYAEKLYQLSQTVQ